MPHTRKKLSTGDSGTQRCGQCQNYRRKDSRRNQLSSALSGLKITLEAYPDLKANQNFLQLQEEIADVENKLAAVRRYFNSATKEYNNAVQTFPSNIIAGMTD